MHIEWVVNLFLKTLLKIENVMKITIDFVKIVKTFYSLVLQQYKEKPLKYLCQVDLCSLLSVFQNISNRHDTYYPFGLRSPHTRLRRRQFF